jgi:hypothetical protein
MIEEKSTNLNRFKKGDLYALYYLKKHSNRNYGKNIEKEIKDINNTEIGTITHILYGSILGINKFYNKSMDKHLSIKIYDDILSNNTNSSYKKSIDFFLKKLKFNTTIDLLEFVSQINSKLILDKIENYQKTVSVKVEYDIENINTNNIEKDKNDEEKSMLIKHPLNTILYGPPGTGKTYNTINKALAIIENKSEVELEKEERDELTKRFNEYKEKGQIEFITFHQSYGYEEFVEGIKADTENGNIDYHIEPGIFKKLSKKAERNLKDSKKDIKVLEKEVSLSEKINEFLSDSLENETEFKKTQKGVFRIEKFTDDKIIVETKDSNFSNNKLTLSIEDFEKIISFKENFKSSKELAKKVF